MKIVDLTNSIKYGIPHSKLIDRVLSLRNSSVNLEYFSIYKLVSPLNNSWKEVPTNLANSYLRTLDNIHNKVEKMNQVETYEYVLPIFSYGDFIYHISEIQMSTYEKTEPTYFLGKSFVETYIEHPEYYIKETPNFPIFTNTAISAKEFEYLLLKQLAENTEIIRYFIEKD